MSEVHQATPGRVRVWRPSRRGARAASRRPRRRPLLVREAVNISPALGVALDRVGIVDLEHLRTLGAVEAWRRIRTSDPAAASTTCLYALEGAIRGVRWTTLAEQDRAALRAAAALFDAPTAGS